MDAVDSSMGLPLIIVPEPMDCEYVIGSGDEVTGCELVIGSACEVDSCAEGAKVVVIEIVVKLSVATSGALVPKVVEASDGADNGSSVAIASEIVPKITTKTSGHFIFHKSFLHLT